MVGRSHFGSFPSIAMIEAFIARNTGHAGQELYTGDAFYQGHAGHVGYSCHLCSSVQPLSSLLISRDHYN